MKKGLLFISLLASLGLASCNTNSGNSQGGGNANTLASGTYNVSMDKMGFTNEGDATNCSAYGIDISFDKGTNTSNSPKYYDTDSTGASVRLYTGNTMTVKAKSITKIELEFSATVSKAEGTFTVDQGTLDESAGFETSTWTGEADEITFTVATKQRRVVSMSITCIGNPNAVTGGNDSSNHTPKSVIQDIINSIYVDPSAVTPETDNGIYYIVEFWGTSAEYTLESAVVEAETFLPDYLVVLYPGEDFKWEEDNSDGYGVTYITDDETVRLDIGSWVESDEIVVQFVAYDTPVNN